MGLKGFSQQDPQYSLYMFNPIGVNPGYAGSREVLSAVLVHRSQWIGLDGAPETQAFSLNMPLKNKKMGLGLQIVNDKIGAHTTQSVKATYAYRLKLGSGKLAFGLSGGIYNYNFDWGKIDYKTQEDAIPTQAAESFMVPTFDFGMYYNTKTFYIGLAAEGLNEAQYNLISIDTVNSQAKQVSHFYATVGKAFILNENLVLKASALLRMSNAEGSGDLNVGILLKNKIYFGASFRKNALVLLTEINLTKRLRMGVGYDLGGSELAKTTSGSLEIFLGYDVNLFKSKVISPRYF
jgi:type IX secretion system PorP/SprF family membrane protein